ncbi:MAG: hypothetical protein EA379_11600 [Phycisphaerales bacterium]|nr:MAG: hypothetical protein EA379_11600 [Phycisphaerales bacterium]
MNAVQKLRQIVGEIRSTRDPIGAREAWALAGRLLSRMPVDQSAAAEACEQRDIEALDALVASIENPRAPATDSSGGSAAPDAPEISPEVLDKAYRVFRKRLKVSRLAEESKLGGRQLTGGRKSEIDAILPPHEYPDEVWKALARSGRIKDTGRGFYSMP